MNPVELSSDPRRLLRVVGLIVAVAMGSTLLVVALLARSTETQIVQSSEVDLAGQQRRLVERLALDVTRLELLELSVGTGEGADDDVDAAVAGLRAEIRAVASSLRAIRTGLLGGDDSLGLDGSVPGDVRALYTTAGLDLDRRLAAYEDAALRLATDGPAAAPDSLAVIEQESVGQVLVRDLDDVVAELSRASALRRSADRSSVYAGLVGVLALSAVALPLLFGISRRVRRQIDENDALAAELATSEDLYRSTVDSLVDGVIIQDHEGRPLRMNAAALRLFDELLDGARPSPDASFGSFLPGLVDETGAPLARADTPTQRVLEGRDLDDENGVVGQIVGLELADGVRWFRSNARLLAHRRGGDDMVVLTFADVTAERLLSEAVAAERHRFRLSLDHAPIGMALVSVDGEFIDVNTAFCDLVGRPVDEMLVSTFQEITHPDDLDVDVALLESLLDGRAETYRLEKRYLRTDGTEVPVLLAVAIVRPAAEGESPYFIAQVVDISDRKRADAALQEALQRERAIVARLSELDEAKSDFVSTVSHELRTPLTSMMGGLEMLSDGDAGPLAPAQARMVEVAERNGRRLASMIEELLTFSRLDAGTPTLDLVDVEPADLVRQVVAMLDPIARQASVNLTGDVASVPAVLRGDRDLLDRVLVNIVGNAIKFTPEDGTVCVLATGGCSADQVEIIVTDTGIGIPLDEQEHLFTRFFRSSTARDNAVPGTGLGLSIAAELVRAHGGEITLDSTPGVGTRVTIRLPVAGPREAGRVG